jgi:disulfide bond formation protein DsbB
MQLAFIESQHERQAFMFAVGIVALSVLAIGSFLAAVMVLFYVFAALAIALGFYMSYHLSRTPAAPAAAPTVRRARKRRR